MPLPKPVLRVAASGHLSRSVFYQRQQLIEGLLDADLDDGHTLAALHVALVADGQVRAAQGTGLGELAGPGSVVYCPSPAPAVGLLERSGHGFEGSRDRRSLLAGQLGEGSRGAVGFARSAVRLQLPDSPASTSAGFTGSWGRWRPYGLLRARGRGARRWVTTGVGAIPRPSRPGHGRRATQPRHRSRRAVPTGPAGKYRAQRPVDHLTDNGCALLGHGPSPLPSAPASPPELVPRSVMPPPGPAWNRSARGPADWRSRTCACCCRLGAVRGIM